MNQLFQRLARAIPVAGHHNLPRYVTESGLGLSVVPSLREGEQSYFHGTWSDKGPGFDPVRPARLRDIAHWKLVLRMIGQSPQAQEVLQADVRPCRSLDGNTFIGHP